MAPSSLRETCPKVPSAPTSSHDRLAGGGPNEPTPESSGDLDETTLMLAQHYTVTRHPFEVVVARLTEDHLGVFAEAIQRARREIDVTNAELDQSNGAPSEGVVVGTLRRTPSGAVIPLHWWSCRGPKSQCDFEGDLDLSPVILDQTLLTLRGHFSLHSPHPMGEAAQSQVCALVIRAFLDGLSFVTP